MGMSANRAVETAEQRRQRLEQMRMDIAATRDAETAEQTEQRLEQVRTQVAANRDRFFQTRLEQKIGTKTADILMGRIIVSKLSETNESIGEMNHVCQFCGACKFKNETSSLCCLDGKVELPLFPAPPQGLMDLWYGDTPEAKLFQKKLSSN